MAASRLCMCLVGLLTLLNALYIGLVYFILPTNNVKRPFLQTIGTVTSQMHFVKPTIYSDHNGTDLRKDISKQHLSKARVILNNPKLEHVTKSSQLSRRDNEARFYRITPSAKTNVPCSKSYKRSHFLRLEFQSGRTGNALLQVNGLLAMALELCMTPFIDKNDFYFRRSFEPIFDLRNVVVENVTYNGTFLKLPREIPQKILQEHHNWTVRNLFMGYKYSSNQEAYIRSSIYFKKEFAQKSEEYLKNHFVSRSTVAIHVRRGDQVRRFNYKYPDFEWYKKYINKAMDYLKRKHSNVSFIFVSDDRKWCTKHFRGVDDVHFSPCETAGCDLALMSRCNHVILTVGTFGWSGAWLGKHDSVIYSKKYMPPKYLNKKLFLSKWVGLQ